MEMDHRRYKHNWFESFDSARMIFTVDLYDGNEPIEVPARYDVCDTCDGKGKHVNPDVDDRGLTAEDFDQDPDMYENYFSGMYDVQCSHCNGLRVVAVIAEDRIDKDLLAKLLLHIQSYYDDQRSDYDVWRAESGYRD
jgi:hypothetical protein